MDLSFLPENEVLDGKDLTTLSRVFDKQRWWVEEAIRRLENRDEAAGMAILYSLTNPQRGLMYRTQRVAQDVAELTMALGYPLAIKAAVSQEFGQDARYGTSSQNYADLGIAGHNGIDLVAPAGTVVTAAHSGVAVAGFDINGFGNYVKVVSGDGKISTIYAHMASVNIVRNERVEAGHNLGLIGSTGRSTGIHLHFGLRILDARNPAYGNYWDPRIMIEF